MSLHIHCLSSAVPRGFWFPSCKSPVLCFYSLLFSSYLKVSPLAAIVLPLHRRACSAPYQLFATELPQSRPRCHCPLCQVRKRILPEDRTILLKGRSNFIASRYPSELCRSCRRFRPGLPQRQMVGLLRCEIDRIADQGDDEGQIRRL